MGSDDKVHDDKMIDEWPASDLERVNLCPICGGSNRRRLHSGLTDMVFHCAPGRWEMYQCADCHVGYLDPRPTPESIGRAYETYFTHEAVSNSDSRRSMWVARFRRALANGYRNYRLGTDFKPSSFLGVFAAATLPNQRAIIEAGLRHITRAVPGMRLLDIGCGNGEFLTLARAAGWDVMGVEPDPEAAAVARSQGLDVREGTIDVLDNEVLQFDGITLNHVIEHVHDPIAVLSRCRSLLRAGGWIWLETPNINAQGHAHYGSAWRGLEPPRHLVLFTRSSLIGALKKAGFERIEDQPYRPVCKQMFNASDAILNKENALGPVSGCTGPSAKAAERAAKCDVNVREFITLKAWASS